VGAAGIDLRSTLTLVWDAEVEAQAQSTATLTASSSSFNPQNAMGKASNQSLL